MIFGLVSTTVYNKSECKAVFGVTTYVAEYLKSTGKSSSDVTVISYQIYSWIVNGVFHFKSPFINYYDGTLAKIKKIILISD